MSQAAFAASNEAQEKDKAKNNTELEQAQKISYDFCGQLGWMDDSYCYLNYGVDSTAKTINNWFIDDQDDSEDPPSTRGRLRFGWEPRSGDFSELDFRFKIRVKLPALEERVELLLSDEEDDVNQQAVKAARSDELGNRDSAVVAVQFKNKASDNMSYRIGFGRGSQLYTRARYTNDIVLSEESKIRYFTEANYYSSDRLGFEANAELGYVFDSRTAFEFTNSFRYRSKTDDWIWRHEIQYLRLGKDDTSYLFTAMIDGLSEPSYRKEQMLLSFRYKKRVLREWLYLEVEPFMLWLREEDFRTSVGLAVRAEVHFST